MKKRLLLLFWMVIAGMALQAQQKVLRLYDGPAPGTESWTWSEAENDNNAWQTTVVYNVKDPTLTVFEPEAGKANGTAIVVCPGGGFIGLSILSEGFDVAKWLAARGVTCFVLKYRLMHTKGNDPAAEFNAGLGTDTYRQEAEKIIPMSIADGRAAIAYVRKHAAEYGVNTDRIGIIGFSAGGTVTASSAFGYDAANKPDFAAPVYPFFPKEMQGPVPADAPPLFITAATDDQLQLAPHSVALYTTWTGAGKPAELHMYAKGGHGFGMRKQNMPSDSWIERFGDWLNSQGLLTKRTVDPVFAPFENKEYITAAGNKLPYRILYPEHYDHSKKYPLVLFLHGAGERGSDNEKQLVHGARLFLDAGNRQKFPAIVIFPQCPQESFWASSRVDRSTQPPKFELVYDGEPNWPLAAATDLVKKVMQEESVDLSRVYVTGLSMGGMGTFEIVYRNPGLFATAMPICGGGDVAKYDKRVARTAFWVFHGDADAVVNVKMSRDMVDQLKKAKAPVKYTEYPGVNHNSWDNAFAEPTYLSWMFSQRRKK